MTEKIDYAKLMTQSSLLRKNLGEDSNSCIDIFALSQNIDGLTIVFYPLGDNLSGICIKGKNGNSLIAINSTMTLGRQRFSMAHEFYHLFYCDYIMSVCAKKLNPNEIIEKSADTFASYFLMPDVALTELIERLLMKGRRKQLSLDDIIRIEQYFGMSHQATVYRLMNTKYLSRDEANKYLTVAVSFKAKELGYSSSLYKSSNEHNFYMTYGNYINQAKILVDEDIISNCKYEELLLDAFRSDLVYGNEKEEDGIID